MKTRCLAVLLSLMLVLAAVPVLAQDVGGGSGDVSVDTTVLESICNATSNEITANKTVEATESSEEPSNSEPVETIADEATEPEQEPFENPVDEENPADEITEPKENSTATPVDEEIPTNEVTEPENEEVVEPEENPAQEPLQEEVVNPINQIIQEPIFPLIPEVQKPEKVFTKTNLKINPKTQISLELKSELSKLSATVQGGENIAVDIYSDDTLVGRIDNGIVTYAVEFLPGNVYVVITGPAGAKFDVEFIFNAVEPEESPAAEDAIPEPDEVIPVTIDAPAEDTTIQD